MGPEEENNEEERQENKQDNKFIGNFLKKGKEMFKKPINKFVMLAKSFVATVGLPMIMKAIIAVVFVISAISLFSAIIDFFNSSSTAGAASARLINNEVHLVNAIDNEGYYFQINRKIIDIYMEELYKADQSGEKDIFPDDEEDGEDTADNEQDEEETSAETSEFDDEAKEESIDNIENWFKTEEYGEYLVKMIRSEIASTYPKLGTYTGTGNADSQGNKKDRLGNYVAQGVVDIHRITIDENGNQGAEVALSYLPHDEFLALIEANDTSAFSYFSFDENSGLIYYAVYREEIIEVDGVETYHAYKIREDSASYKSLTAMCSMPYNFLFALLQTSSNPNYVSAVADLLLQETEVVLTIHDQLNKKTSTTVNYQVQKTTTQEREKEIKRIRHADGTVEEEENWVFVGEESDPVYEFPKGDKETVVTTIYENTAKVGLTKAKTWSMDFAQEFTLDEKDTPGEEVIVEHTDEEYDELSYSPESDDSDREDTTVTRIYLSNDKIIYTTKNDNLSYTWTSKVLQEKSINDERFLGLWKNKNGYYDSNQLRELLDKLNEKKEKGLDYSDIQDKIEEEFYYKPDGKDVAYLSPIDDKPKDVVVDNISDNNGTTINDLLDLLSVRDNTDVHMQLMKHYWNVYYGEEIYEVNMEELLNLFNTELFTSSLGSSYGKISINWVGNIDRNEFIDFMDNSSFAGKSDFTGENAGKIWDICKDLNVNPVYCVSQAAFESGYGEHIGNSYNYWGIGVFTDTSSGYGYSSMEEAVKRWCDLILSYQNGNMYTSIVNSGQQAYNEQNGNKFSGGVNNVYDVAIKYASLPNLHNASCYGYTSKTFITDVLNMTCTHANSDGVTDEEQAAYSVWYGNQVTSIAKTIFGSKAFGGGASEVVELALSLEGERHSRFTSYKTTTGLQFSGDDWCAMFVSYCFDQCGLIPDALTEPYTSCTYGGVPNAKKAGRFRDLKAGENYLPKAGDIIFYTKNGGTTSYHTGIVVDCDGTYVYTVEGNTGYSSGATDWHNSWVSVVKNSLSYERIYGYWEM